MRTLCFVCLIAVSIGSPFTTAYGRDGSSFLNPPASNLLPRQKARSLAIGDVLSSRNSASKKSLRALTQSTSPVARGAIARYADFASYWAVSNKTSQRTGKTFEAVLAWRANKVLSNGESMLATAAEGYPSDPTDLVRVSAKNEVLQRYQAKLRLNLKTASRHLADPRYAGQSLVTTRDSLEKVIVELEKETSKATRRGIPLAPKYQRVADALKSGLLPSDWYGKPLPSERGLAEFAKKATQEQFESFAAAAERQVNGYGGSSIASTPSNRGKVMNTAKRVLGKGVIILNIADVGYGTYQDINRYTRGEVGGGYVAVKGTMRAGQIAITILLLTPEPVFSKSAAAVISVVLVVADVGYEVVHGNAQRLRQDSTQRLLEKVDRVERFENVRRQLLANTASR